MKVVDASVAIDVLRGDRRAIDALATTARTGDHLIGSEITRFEVLAGVLPSEETATERFLGELVWIPVTELIARRGASLAREHRAANRGIDDADYLVAATTLELGAELLTTNVRHLPMLPGLVPAY